MKIIVGLGNPGQQYEMTRHNVGFWAVDLLAEAWDIPLREGKFKGLIGEGRVGGEKVLLVKPLTYMNLSGECVGSLISFYKVDPKESLLVIYDDLDLPCGKIRLRTKGSSGGHNGMKSLIAHLGTEEFKRIKIGIGRPAPGRKVADYVLSTFPPEELAEVQEAVKKSAEAAKTWMGMSFLRVMNQFN
ncbi:MULTISPECIES: aminoacyl-tRNA hydrolase [Aneurinibacillus]|uniref:Peptidyl-tRNA hydrolase n=1 Tax=Aneurinibacillus thermoaerophilus TaxID=143495 RepID=A0A1G8DQ60_ANETH|nr:MULTISPECIES: aminoacyl-tRNA hydrolase [Aneurinibacillus]AMA74521.1 peptidyl-tRNA hydrolase [Aneurinibacillus sp. XH2]MED0675143.1 aminoacyl-tRNA hydrolase [Aneurinibacillus thermoaerophilus]MED0681247.1 aminoacyl-tRNA hydrolase [Aneurinibacillus thermoaerophilus]MED0738828.1 aminoacyl-tRNA hydrolase [Aneurinibacillus thermoaerophilus]MED0757723.1 aminoacyl-tRNA hydrolase [Aneurinibacillus thermoaerophilus]